MHPARRQYCECKLVITFQRLPEECHSKEGVRVSCFYPVLVRLVGPPHQVLAFPVQLLSHLISFSDRTDTPQLKTPQTNSLVCRG